MAFPGDVDRPKVAGCLALIRDGALLVRDAADIFAQLGIAGGAPATPLTLDLGTVEAGGDLGRAIVARLAHEPLRIDALIDGCESPAALFACIGELISAGIVVESSDALLRLAP
jgi:DNA processing protein